MKAITLKAARIVGPLTLEIDWSTGETLRAKLAGWLRPPFDALTDPALFAQITAPFRAWWAWRRWPTLEAR